jgi:hypothetical protein
LGLPEIAIFNRKLRSLVVLPNNLIIKILGRYPGRGEAILWVTLVLFLFSCQKDSSPDNTNPVPGIKGFLKQYRWFNPPEVSPDSITVDIVYDTVEHSITLKQDFTGLGPTAWWKYRYNSSGYLISVYDVTPGNNPEVLLAAFTYDANNDLTQNLTYENKIVPYNTVYTSSGKTVTMYDTTVSGYQGGTVIFGKGTVVYNKQNQMKDRYLNFGSIGPGTAAVLEHEIFAYDGADNIVSYTYNDSRYYINSYGLPDSSFYSTVETYDVRDTKGHELYAFDSLLMKGVLNQLGGNALIDPLQNIIGVGKSMFFQTQNTALLQASFPNGNSLSNQPLYDSLGRLVKTSIFDTGIPGKADIYLSYY